MAGSDPSSESMLNFTPACLAENASVSARTIASDESPPAILYTPASSSRGGAAVPPHAASRRASARATIRIGALTLAEASPHGDGTFVSARV